MSDDDPNFRIHHFHSLTIQIFINVYQYFEDTSETASKNIVSNLFPNTTPVFLSAPFSHSKYCGQIDVLDCFRFYQHLCPANLLGIECIVQSTES
jgi:hypothetical protein